MSTDLQLRQDLPRIQVPPIKIQTLGSCSATTEDHGDVIQQENIDECRTPTSEEHRIPAVLRCPPAPRKPRRRTVSYKRKLSEFEFFEILNRQEVESFFLSSFEAVAAAKKRCPYK
ncbi:hypothetical protein P3X46_014016 [Hevea brasiliensis]|uniref:Cyclin-dependent protein kinase inhibitor n=1 Tax=Hevea brasiliensis TaxID=3981 RepID=A0ABQ9M909_HEVBR|nr:cyclin-dependent protein kinase inhibitor SMR1-like [Hevea brasiliensis]KAJ9175465.1 hypothetical protein P3X46_014016 [Hevea brasiliensis]